MTTTIESPETKVPSTTAVANKLYSAAMTALRLENQARFDEVLEAEYGRAGLKRKVRRTAEQAAAEKAAAAEAKTLARALAARESAVATIAALFAEYPDVAVEFTASDTPF